MSGAAAFPIASFPAGDADLRLIGEFVETCIDKNSVLICRLISFDEISFGYLSHQARTVACHRPSPEVSQDFRSTARSRI